MEPAQRYLQGSTIRLMVRVSDVASDDPREVDSVTLISLTGAGSLSAPFTEVETGLYEYLLDSAELEPGIYEWRASVVETGVGVSVVEDSFVVL